MATTEAKGAENTMVGQMAQKAPPGVLVIFGAGGDLTKRKLFPALYNLAKEGLLLENFAVVGFGRSAPPTDKFQQAVREDLKKYANEECNPKWVEWLAERAQTVVAEFSDATGFSKLRELLTQIDVKYQTGGNYLFYLATAPQFFATIPQMLQQAGLTEEKEGRWRRVIVEKPFGRDLQSAKELNTALRAVLREEQIYRIDHYLGKETVQNILVFRFANGIFEPVWNRRYIDHVQITVSETVGVEMRGGYYETSGALRDMLPNHMFQLVTLIAMEPPISFDANAVRDEQAKILRAIQPFTPEDVLSRTARGQYGAGKIDGESAPGYRGEPRVSPQSNTETFVATKLKIDNWRLADVPFYLRTGKRLPKRVTEIVIQFRRPPFVLFRQTPVAHLTPNQLVLNIQPDEGIALNFSAKVPGPVVRLGSVEMDFCYADQFGRSAATGYERLLYDAMLGDATLFQREDMVEAAWSVVQPILDVWQALPPRKFPNYAAGTWGPEEAEEMMAKDGRKWHEA